MKKIFLVIAVMMIAGSAWAGENPWKKPITPIPALTVTGDANVGGDSNLVDIESSGTVSTTGLHIPNTNVNHALVSFVFDDICDTQYDNAFPQFQESYATIDPVMSLAVVLDWIGQAVASYPDASCATSTNFMNLTELQAIVAAGGEVLSHSKTHSWGGGTWFGGANKDYTTELQGSRNALETLGFNVYGFVYPGGYESKTLRNEVRKYYDYALPIGGGIYGSPYQQRPIDNYRILRVDADGASAATIQGYIDTAITNRTWLVLMFHDMTAAKSAIIGDVLTHIDTVDNAVVKTVDVVNIRDGVKAMGNAIYQGDAWEGGIHIGGASGVRVPSVEIRKPFLTSDITFSGTGVNDLAIITPSTATAVTTWCVEIQTAANPDVIRYKNEACSTGSWDVSSVAIGTASTSANLITLTGGTSMVIQFDTWTGHTAGAQWEWTVYPSTQDLFAIKGIDNTSRMTVNNLGQITLRPLVNSGYAFTVQLAAGTGFYRIDMNNGYQEQSADGGSTWQKVTVAGAALTNRAVCWKDTANSLGYCSTQPDANGACTCN